MFKLGEILASVMVLKYTLSVTCEVNLAQYLHMDAKSWFWMSIVLSSSTSTESSSK